MIADGYDKLLDDDFCIVVVADTGLSDDDRVALRTFALTLVLHSASSHHRRIVVTLDEHRLFKLALSPPSVMCLERQREATRIVQTNDCDLDCNSQTNKTYLQG